MRIRARLTAPLVALVAGFAAIALSARAEDSPTCKTFAENNFKLTLPSAEWKFEEVIEENRQDGWVTIARRQLGRGLEVSAWIRVVDANGAEVDSLMAQVKELKAKGFDQVTESKMESTVWAGVSATLLTVKGKYANGSVRTYRVYGAVIEGQFHEMDVRIANAADETIGKEIDALVDGYRVLKGGPAGSEGSGTETPAGMDDAPMEGGDSPAEPPAGPADPQAKRFPNAGLSWSIPKPPEEADKPHWEWAKQGNPSLARTDNGLLAIAFLVLPDGSYPVVLELHIQPTQPGATAQNFAENTKNTEDQYKNFSGSPIPNVDEEVNIGNFHGSAVSIKGKDLQDPPKPLQIRLYMAVQKRTLFLTNVHFHDGAEKTYKTEFRAALDGLKWDDPTEGIRAPLLMMALRPDTEPRGKFVEKDIDAKVPKGHGFSLTNKPAGFALLPIDGTNKEAQYADHQVFWFAAEARTPKTYAYLGVSSYAAKDLMDQRPPRDAAAFIDELEGEWKSLFPDAKTRPKSEKTNRAPGSLNGAQGSAYVFTGSIRGLPYVEYGWVVKSSQFYFWVRQQYAGKDAEAAHGAGMKTMIKSLKYE